MNSNFQPIHAASIGYMPDCSIASEDIAISCHDNEMPPFVEVEMDRLYQNFFSSLAKFRLDGALRNVSTYVVRKNGKPATILLFRREKKTVTVLNEVIRLDEEDIRRFTTTIFSAFESVDTIMFSTIQTDLGTLPFPYQRFNTSEDIALALPDTPEKYRASLGHNTKRNVKRYSQKLKGEFPSFRYDVYTKEEADERLIREIIDFNRVRMSGKNKVSDIDEKEACRIVSRVKMFGFVGVATIDGRVCSGQICYRVGDSFFMDVIGHDTRYDDYWLGTLCCYLVICECIRQGGKEFHFLWGHYDYKYTLLGVRRDLDHVVVYRSRTHLMLNAALALQTEFNGAVRKLKLWLRSNSPASRFAARFIRRVRSLKASRPWLHQEGEK
ncbi:MAG: family N-acetyltransferase [Herminiimonas sp.]|nr:family N-acetyltransferase [Herminiimonas sp.]